MNEPDFVRSTENYKQALRDVTAVSESALKRKDQEMALDAFAFLRATYYRWAELFPELCPELAASPTVLGVGDAHVQNFGTWRDAEGRLVWGIDDFDEADEDLPMASDLVRLATSAVVAKDVKVPTPEICAHVLDGYARGLQSGGMPFVLDDRHTWLRDAAHAALKDPTKFWSDWLADHSLPIRPKSVPKNVPADAQAALCASFPHRQVPETFRVPNPGKPKGLGSLGKLRFFGYTETFCGGPIAREAKAVAPPATRIGRDRLCFVDRIQRVAVRSRDPEYRVRDGWVLKSILAATGRIEIAKVGATDKRRLLRAMGRELANVHLGSRDAEELGAGLATLREQRRLVAAVGVMSKRIDKELRIWRKWQGGQAAARLPSSPPAARAFAAH